MPENMNPIRRRILAAAIVTLASAQARKAAAADAPAIVKKLAEGPVIAVPTITLEGDANGAPHADPSAYASKFSGRYAHRLIGGGVGHNLPQEAPQAFAQAVIDVDAF